MSSRNAGARGRPFGVVTILGCLLVVVLLATAGTGLAAGGETAGALKPYDPDTLRAPQPNLLEPEPQAPTPPPPPPPSQATLVSGIHVPTDAASSSLLATAVGDMIQLVALTAAALILAGSLRHRARRLVLVHGIEAVRGLTEAVDLDAVDRRQLAKVVRAEPGLDLAEVQGRLQVAGVVDRHHRRGRARFYPAGRSPEPVPPTVTVPSVRWRRPGWRYLSRKGRALKRSLARGTAPFLASLRRGLEALEAACRTVAERGDGQARGPFLRGLAWPPDDSADRSRPDPRRRPAR